MSQDETFKEVALITDSRALELIREKREELDSFLNGESPETTILKQIAKEEDFRKFTKTLKNVDDYLGKKEQKFTSENSKKLASVLKETFNLSREQIVMVLNQPPCNDSQLEIMFPGKFSKEQCAQLISLITQMTLNMETWDY